MDRFGGLALPRMSGKQPANEGQPSSTTQRPTSAPDDKPDRDYGDDAPRDEATESANLIPPEWSEYMHSLSTGSSNDFDFDFGTEQDAVAVRRQSDNQSLAGQPDTNPSTHRSLQPDEANAGLDEISHDRSSQRSRGKTPVRELQHFGVKNIDPRLLDCGAEMPQNSRVVESPEDDDYESNSQNNASVDRGDVSGPSRQTSYQERTSDLARQCEHSAECTRPGRRVTGKYDGRRLCTRHGVQWETKNSGPPRWRPVVVPTDLAIARIRPDIVPPSRYSKYFDQSLLDHRDGLHEWTLRFHEAAMVPYTGDGDDRAGANGLLKHQKTLEERARSRRYNQYSEFMINSRLSLLFPIALAFHQGGAAVYPIGGDSSGYREDTSLSFIQRLELVEEVLKVNKLVVMNVIEGKGVEAFVRGPRDFAKRKNTNKKGNFARQERGVACVDTSLKSSRQPSIGIGEPGPAPRANRYGTPTSSAPPEKCTAIAHRKRKRSPARSVEDGIDIPRRLGPKATMSERCSTEELAAGRLTAPSSASTPTICPAPQQRSDSEGSHGVVQGDQAWDLLQRRSAAQDPQIQQRMYSPRLTHLAQESSDWSLSQSASEYQRMLYSMQIAAEMVQRRYAVDQMRYPASEASVTAAGHATPALRQGSSQGVPGSEQALYPQKDDEDPAGEIWTGGKRFASMEAYRAATPRR